MNKQIRNKISKAVDNATARELDSIITVDVSSFGNTDRQIFLAQRELKIRLRDPSFLVNIARQRRGCKLDEESDFSEVN